LLPDIRSIMFMGILAVAVCLVVIVGLWQQSRRQYRGMDLLVIDFAAQVAGLVLILARNVIPDWASIVLANALVATGSVLGYVGLQRFVGLRTSQLHNWVLVAVFTAVHAWFALVEPDLAARTLNLAIVMTLIWGQCAWLLLVRADEAVRRVTWGVGLVFLAYCLVNGARIVEFFVGPARSADFFLSGAFDRLVLLAYQTLFLLLTFSLVLMVNRRLVLDVELKEAAEATRRASDDAMQASLAQSDRLTSMGMLAAGVAHEINNPLTYVLYNLETLVEDVPKLGETARRCAAILAARGLTGELERTGGAAQTISAAAVADIVERLQEASNGSQRIERIARGLGSFSRVERTDQAPIDVHACLDHAMTMASNEMKFRASVVRDLGAVPAVMASEGKLAQVFLNLLINAAHAIEPGHVDQNEIRVRTYCEADGVCIEVSDTGEGISPDHQQHLFEPFFTTKPAGSGAGLGLWITRNIVRGFGGEIRFTSELGRGSTFTVVIPAITHQGDPAIEAQKDSDASVPSLRGRILVVDDEAGIRGSLSRIFKRDHEVVLARSGAEGRGILERDQSFDVILCDLMMPEMSGMDLHAWIAAEHPALAPRIVFITGGAFTPGASEYLASTGNPVVKKPFHTGALKKLVHDVMARAGNERAPQS